MTGSTMKTTSKMMIMKTMSLLCLMMILPGGLGSPVAGEGGFGLDFVAGLTDFFIGDGDGEGVTEKIVVEGALGRGRSFNAHSVRHLGYAMDVEIDSSCCQECWKTYPETQLVSFENKAGVNDFNKNCKCLKSKQGENPTTHQIGKVSGGCGVLHIEGLLEDGFMYDSSTVDWKGSVTKVNESAACCQECNKKHPGSTMYTFDKENQFCLCYDRKMGTGSLQVQISYTASACVPAITEDTADNDASLAKDEVSEAVVSVEEHSQSDASTGSGIKPDVAALTITEKPGCQKWPRSRIACCPQFTPGDNAGPGKETFVQEYDLIDGDCQKTCQNEEKFPNSVGMTQHMHQKYSNGKPKCWCESGEPHIDANAENYQTCLF